MIKKIKIILAAAIATSGLLLAAAPLPALADDCDTPNTVQQQLQCGANGASGQTNPAPSDAAGKFNNITHTLINVLTIIVGIIAVIMIIVGGLRYVTSGGDANKVSAAKNTLLYAIIGLVIVALAQVIVNFVLDKTTSAANGNGGVNPSQTSGGTTTPRGKPPASTD